MKNYNHSKLTILDNECLEILHENAKNARIKKNVEAIAAERKKRLKEDIITFLLLCLIMFVFGSIGGLLTR